MSYTYSGYTCYLLWQVSDEGIRYTHSARHLTILAS